MLDCADGQQMAVTTSSTVADAVHLLTYSMYHRYTNEYIRTPSRDRQRNQLFAVSLCQTSPQLVALLRPPQI